MAEIKSNGSEFYDYVVSFNYPHDDYISALLINDYKAYILSDNKKTKKYDEVINEYINNKEFSKYIHQDKELNYYISDTKFYLINKYNEYKDKLIHQKGIWL